MEKDKTIFVYTDASTEGKVGVAVSIIKRRDQLIKVLVGEYPIIGPSAAELYGLLQSVKYLKQNYPNEKIVVFTDLETSVRTFEKLRENPSYTGIAYHRVWRQVIRHSKDLDITLKHFDSHLSICNENVACDRYAFIVRNKLELAKSAGIL